MGEGLGLAELQRWMIGRLHDELSGVEVDRVVAPSATLTACERLAIYRRGYELRLVECLRAMHPALIHLLGHEVFDAFARDFLAARPPAGYTLFRLNEGFADHLAATRPPAPEAWPDLLIDVARFERAFLEVYDGEGAEGEAIASSADVPAAAAAAAAGGCCRGCGCRAVAVTPVPCLRVLRSRYPVGAYVTAVRRGEEPPIPLPCDTHLALVRRDYRVELVGLAPDGFTVLDALRQGADSATAGRSAGVPCAAVLHMIAGWADKGLFRRVVDKEGSCC